MWNTEFKPGAVFTATLEAGLRPEPDPLSPKANLQAIVSILAVGVLRWRAQNGASPSDAGRRTCFPVQPERSYLTNASSRAMRGLPVNESGKGSPESSNGSRVRHSILRQLATLETMSMEQLRERWRDLYGGEPPGYKRQFSDQAPSLSHSGAVLRRPAGSGQDPPAAGGPGRPGGPCEPPGLRQSPEPDRHPAGHPVRPDMEGLPL